MLVESHIFSVVISESRVHLGVWFLAYVRRVDVLLGPVALVKKFCSPGLVIFLGRWMTSQSSLLVTTDSEWVGGWMVEWMVGLMDG